MVTLHVGTKPTAAAAGIITVEPDPDTYLTQTDRPWERVGWGKRNPRRFTKTYNRFATKEEITH